MVMIFIGKDGLARSIQRLVRNGNSLCIQACLTTIISTLVILFGVLSCNSFWKTYLDTILYLVRHVESSPNDIVTESGLQQAQSLAKALSKIEIDLIISSPYQRAIDTVKPFSEIAQIPIQI